MHVFSWTIWRSRDVELAGWKQYPRNTWAPISYCFNVLFPWWAQAGKLRSPEPQQLATSWQTGQKAKPGRQSDQANISNKVI